MVEFTKPQIDDEIAKRNNPINNYIKKSYREHTMTPQQQAALHVTKQTAIELHQANEIDLFNAITHTLVQLAQHHVLSIDQLQFAFHDINQSFGHQ